MYEKVMSLATNLKTSLFIGFVRINSTNKNSKDSESIGTYTPGISWLVFLYK